ncbi:hypothetical protein, partial [Escherichia coli]|uniref:hypothetical protein n=1 Tax=Escherichia coli TaxID=562 RepID=UPI001BC9FE36
INTYKPEDQLFVSGIHKERNIQVCTVLNGIVKTIKAQNFCVFFVKEVIFVNATMFDRYLPFSCPLNTFVTDAVRFAPFHHH